MSATSLALAFRVEGAEPLAFAAVPTLRFALAIESAGPEPIRSLLLDVQLQIAARRRGYDGDEQARLLDLFGEPARWGTTLRTLPWTRATLVVPGFAGATVAALDVPCTYDFEVAASKYLHALRDGAVPLQFLFSGTIFSQGARGFAVQQVPWDREDHFEMPVSVWRDLMQQHYPNTGWLRLDRDTLDGLAAYRSARGLLSLDEAVTSLLDASSTEETDERALGPCPRRRRRGALRGLSTLPVPRQLAKEPVALAVRSAGAAGRSGHRHR